MKNLKRLCCYTMVLVAGILLSLSFNFFSSKKIEEPKIIQTENIINTSPNSGFRYTISKNKNIKSNAENLFIENNCSEFYLNINNYFDVEKPKNSICVFLNNIQVSFDFNDNKNNKNYVFDLEPKNNCFTIKINDLKITESENDLLIIISNENKDYDITNAFEEKKSNSIHFVNTKIYNYSIKNNIAITKEKYENYDYENASKINDGIYINKSLNKNTINGSNIIKAKPNEKIYIPIIIKNMPTYNEASLILLINDEQYKLNDKNYINIKLNNSLAKTKLFFIETPNAKGNYKLKIAMCCKNNEHRQYFISNTINLILE